MTNLTILSNKIRLLDGLYSLNDLHKASGGEKRHQPNRFIRIEQTQDLIKEIDRCPDVGIALKTKRGGNLQGTFVCKELVYSYAMWVSAKFQLAVIRAFDSMRQQPPAQALPHPRSRFITEEQAGHLYQTVMDMAHSGRGAYQSLFGLLKRQFGVNSYKNILKTDYKAACHVLGVNPKQSLLAQTANTPISHLQAPISNITPLDGRYLVTLTDGKVSSWISARGKSLVDTKRYNQLNANLTAIKKQIRWLNGEENESVFND